MSDPKRLVDETDLTALEARVLGSARREAPDALKQAVRERITARLSTSTHPSQRLRRGTALAVAALLAAAVATGAVLVARGHLHSATPMASTGIAGRARGIASTTAPAPAPPAEAAASGSEALASPKPAPAAAEADKRGHAVPARPSASSDETGLAESRAVAEARSQLRAGHAAEALAQLEQIRARYPNGLLVQEREALAIEALLAEGQHEVARRRATAFLARYPKSPYAAALEAALSASSP